MCNPRYGCHVRCSPRKHLTTSVFIKALNSILPTETLVLYVYLPTTFCPDGAWAYCLNLPALTLISKIATTLGMECSAPSKRKFLEERYTLITLYSKVKGLVEAICVILTPGSFGCNHLAAYSMPASSLTE